MSDGPSAFWPYACHGPQAGSVLTFVKQVYHVEIYCIARPLGARSLRDLHVLRRAAFAWSYQFTVAYDPWGPTPPGAGRALNFQSFDLNFAVRGSDGRRPRIDGPLALDQIERELDAAGIAPVSR